MNKEKLIPCLSGRGVTKIFGSSKINTVAVDNIDFDFYKVDSVLLDCINMRDGKHLPKEKKIELITEACKFVNLKFAELTNKYPFELSGGQMQSLIL